MKNDGWNGGKHALPAMLCRGVGMPRPHEFYTPNRRGISLPCVGVVPRAANENLYDCRWQSYLYYVAARKGSRRGCTVGSCRGLSNGGFQRIDSLHPLSHGLWPVTAPPTQGSQRPDGSFPAQGSQRPDGSFPTQVSQGLAGSFYFTQTAPSMRLSIHSRRGR